MTVDDTCLRDGYAASRLVVYSNSQLPALMFWQRGCPRSLLLRILLITEKIPVCKVWDSNNNSFSLYSF